MGKKAKKYYAVAAGRKPGIYKQWYGEDGAEAQVRGYPKAVFKGFASLGEAEAFLKQPTRIDSTSGAKRSAPGPGKPRKQAPAGSGIRMYTDGGCIRNPGPGGYGVVIIEGKKRKELSGGFRLTTNNRMELMACIVGLRQLKPSSKVTLHSDSKYVVNGITRGWAKRWRSNNWMRTPAEPAINPDLWEQLLDLCDAHEVDFVWIKGHAGHPENERCDQLSSRQASMPDLPADEAYEQGVKRNSFKFIGETP